MNWLLPIVSGLAVAFLGWFALNFLGKPLLKFLEIRNKVSETLAVLDTIRPFDAKRLMATKSALLELGVEMKALD